jgi:hypothetical protein
VPNGYMVVFKKHVKHTDASDHHSWVQKIHSKGEQQRMELRKRSHLPLTADVLDGLKHTYNIVGGIMGYSGHFDDETIEQIRRHPDVSLPRISVSSSAPLPTGAVAPRGCLRYAIARDPMSPWLRCRYPRYPSHPFVPINATGAKANIACHVGRLHREGLHRPHNERQGQ